MISKVFLIMLLGFWKVSGEYKTEGGL